MAEKLTPQQAEAVVNRGGKLLVSAAAGSGKTKVLVDRLMGYLTDPIAPANLDAFLIITYTKAAAAELRGKIAAKLTEKIAEQPNNRHLQQQLQRLYLAKISTVHAFCADILREYAYELDISSDFRVADENECRELRERAADQVLTDAYEAAELDLDFCAFVDTQGMGRDDQKVPEILLKVYDSARCHLHSDAWLENCVKNTGAIGCGDAGQTLWGRYLMENLFTYLDKQIAAMEKCVKAVSLIPKCEKPMALLRDTVFQLRHLRESTTWDEIRERRNIEYGTLRFPPKCADPAAECAKAVRNACKEGVGKRLKFFADNSAHVLADLSQSEAAVRGLVKLVGQFEDAYNRLKKSRRVLDFSDLEHKALDLLLGRERSAPTAIAREIGQRFREIMVDEYQDSNEVQDAIFSALTEKKQNCFMVGDVKQSIYQFRLADPGIFLKKYESYRPAGTAEPGYGRKVLLSSNFRSGGGVIEAVNHVFSTCMSHQTGGMLYGEEEALREGVPHISLNEPEVELHTLITHGDTYREEAAFTAERIAELLNGTHMVRQGERLRPIAAGDIVILLRSPKAMGQEIQRALACRGIPCAAGGGCDLLQTEEIGTLRAILQTVSNPRQDIPLLATLASPVFGFTADDLAAFRGKQRWGSIYDALLMENSRKTKVFLDALGVLRKEARMNTLAELLEQIFTLTRMDSVYMAMQDGETRMAHLHAFYQLAVDFETNGRPDLSQFLDYLESMEEKGLMISNENGKSECVTIMSIHNSKGLEFPVVFLCGLSREFNLESVYEQVLCDKTLGLGLSCVDLKKRIRYSSIAKRAISAKILSDSISEEMRVLYVAMTRARDRLIMTYAGAEASLRKTLSSMALRSGWCNRDLITQDVLCPGKWVLFAALQRTEAGALFQLGDRPESTAMYSNAWRITVSEASEAVDDGLASIVEEKRIPQENILRIQRGLAFTYPHPEATLAPSKQTATQRKGRDKDQEAAENAGEPREIARLWRKPSFVDDSIQGRNYGSAIHAVLQYIRYEVCTGKEGVAREVQRLVAERFITEEQGKLVNCQAIAKLFETDLGKKLQKSSNVLREFKFSILDDGAQYGLGLEGEQVLLQGVVDCALIEQNGIIIVDFKTDHVTEKTLPATLKRYRPQVEAYADALARIYQKAIKEKYLYFFHLGRFVSI